MIYCQLLYISLEVLNNIPHLYKLSGQEEELTEKHKEAKAIVIADIYNIYSDNNYQYLLDEKKWVQINKFPKSVGKIFGVFEINDVFYVVGRKGISTLNNEFYEFPTDIFYSWSQSYQIGNNILIFRTLHDLKFLEFKLFDSVIKQLIDVDIKVKRIFFDVVYYLNQLWIIGGSKPVEAGKKHLVFKTIQTYNLITKTTSLSPVKMIQARFGHKVIVYKDNLFVFGGCDKDEKVLNTVEMYSPKTNKFVTMAPMKIARLHFVCSRVGNLVYVIKGDSGKDAYVDSDSVEIYNLDTNTWTTGQDFPKSLCSWCYLYGCAVKSKLE